MIRAIALSIVLAGLALGSAHAKPEVIDGQWLFRFPCDRLTGMYADRCKGGEGDFFQLFLRKTGNKVCGSWAVTTQGTNHADEGDVGDWTFLATKSSAEYHVSFNLDGESGEATIRIDGDKLYWDVTNEAKAPEPNSIVAPLSLPTHAILIKQPSKKEWPPCSTTNRERKI